MSADDAVDGAHRRPAHIDVADWQQAIEDGRRFITPWLAEALGWTSIDLFGLHSPPEKPALNYRRWSRYDHWRRALCNRNEAFRVSKSIRKTQQKQCAWRRSTGTLPGGFFAMTSQRRPMRQMGDDHHHADPLYQHLIVTAERKFWRSIVSMP